MLVTEITKTRRGRFSVFIDDEFYGVLHPDVYFLSNIKVGIQVEPKELDQLIYESQKNIAKERALSLLSARPYTKKGLIDKLLRDVDIKAAEEVAHRMEELGLIDDEDYARRYANDCINLRGFSHFRTRLALRERGIDERVIDKTILNLGDEDSERLIYRQIKRRYLNRIDDEVGERRTIAALQRRGFRYEDIALVIENLKEDKNYYKYDELFED